MEMRLYILHSIHQGPRPYSQYSQERIRREYGDMPMSTIEGNIVGAIVTCRLKLRRDID
jgi:hypothetical protein